MKRGLILEGGAMRGIFTAGVMDVMLEKGIVFDGIAGVSAGAAFGCNYKSRQAGRVIRYNLKMAKNWRFCSVRSLLLTGNLIGAKYAYHTLPNKIDIFDRETYDANPTRFYAVCTDVETAHPVYKELPQATDEAFEWIRASASMPLCSRIVHIGDYRLLDGGITDSIPLKFMETMGYDTNVVVLTQPKNYVKEPNRLMPVLRIGLNKHPQLVEALEKRPEMYNDQVKYVEKAEQEGRAIVIRPPFSLPIGHICHDPKMMREVYEIGREAAESTIDRLV